MADATYADPDPPACDICGTFAPLRQVEVTIAHVTDHWYLCDHCINAPSTPPDTHECSPCAN